MRFTQTILVLGILVAWSGLAAPPAQAQPCDGVIDIDGMGAGAWGQPFRVSSNDARTTSVYEAGEFPCEGGHITGMSYYIAALPPTPYAMNLTIRLKHTYDPELYTPVFDNDGWVVCFEGTVTITALGWYTFNFTTPFAYDSQYFSQNLLVDVSFNNSGHSTSSYRAWAFADGIGLSRTLFSYCNDCGCGSPPNDPLQWTTCAGAALIPQVPRVQFIFGGTKPTGACCFGDGTCEEHTAEDCASLGGAYQDDGTTCTPSNPCPQATGACCLFGGNCQVFASAECLSFGGTYLGDGTSCTPTNPCPQACCFADGSCQLKTSPECSSAGGVFQGENTSCAPTNPCPAGGACCFSDGTCQVKTAVACLSAGGTWQAAGTACTPMNPCPQPAACCFSNGSCLERVFVECISQGGTNYGAGTHCTPANPCPQPGTCCWADGTCQVTLESGCTPHGGTWDGASNTCTPSPCPPVEGACCFEDGHCEQMPEEDCLPFAGTAWSMLQPCNPSPCPLCDSEQVAKLTDPDGVAHGWFGRSVAIDGDTMLIGTPWPGSVHVYVRSGGVWTWETELTAWDVPGGAFGWSVALDGDTAVIGAVNADPDGIQDAGAAYVYVHSAGVWTPQGKLTAPDLAPGSGYPDNFGFAVAISADTVLIGARDADPNGVQDAGAAYVYTRSAGTWTFRTKLTAADGAPSDEYGSAVALDGDTALVGAPFNGPRYVGAAYVYTRSWEVWTPQAKLTVPDPGGSWAVQLAYHVALQGDTALVNAGGRNAAGVETGTAYVFVRSSGAWNQQARLIGTDTVYLDGFGGSVALDGDMAVISATGDDHAGGLAAGSAYVFVRTGEEWRQRAKLTAADATDSDQFGTAVAVDGNSVVVGAPYSDQNGLTMAGAAYVFDLNCPGACCFSDGSCQPETALKCSSLGGIWQGTGIACSPSNPCPQLGACCSLDGHCEMRLALFCQSQCGDVWYAGTQCSADLCAVPLGACCFPDGHCEHLLETDCVGAGGAAWSMGATCDAGPCPQCDTQLVAELVLAGPLPHAHLGPSVALSGDTLALGAGYDGPDGTLYAGSVYVFSHASGTWLPQIRLRATDMSNNAFFGASVALDGDTLAVGAYGDDPNNLNDAGSVYVYSRLGGVWTFQLKLVAPDAVAGDWFGYKVAISGNTILVGAVSRGAAYVFVGSGTQWSYQGKLTASDATSGDQFGAAVALDGDTAVIGAYHKPLSPGAAYVFVRSNGDWTEQAKLLPANGWLSDYYGWSVAVKGERALVGAFLHNPIDWGVGAGSAYVYRRSDGVWSPETMLYAADAVCLDYFGWSVALSDDTAVIGAPEDDNAGGLTAGAVYVFDRVGASWTQRDKLTASDGAQDFSFGSSVALESSTALVGRFASRNASNSDAGAGYVFQITCPRPPTGGCCVGSACDATQTASDCALVGGIYLGDSIPCVSCASAGGVGGGETVTLNPGGGSGDPTQDSLVTFTNTSGMGDATVTVGETDTNPHPGAGGFQAFGRTLVIETSLGAGQFFMTVEIPFTQADLPPMADPLRVNLTHFDAASGTWRLAVDGNTQNSPGHAGPRGDRFPISGDTPPALSPDLGDYGVFWNPALAVGFVWANVDHVTDFAAGVSALHAGDLNCDGGVNFDDINPFVKALIGQAGYEAKYPSCRWLNGDINGDGTVSFDDINPFVKCLVHAGCP